MRYTNKNKFRGLFFGNRLGFYYKDTLQLSDREIRLINSLKFRPSDFLKMRKPASHISRVCKICQEIKQYSA